jgi:hypothetical protein
MSNSYNDIHLEQVFEDATEMLYKIVVEINKLRDLAMTDDLDYNDYLEITETIREALDGRLDEVINRRKA